MAVPSYSVSFVNPVSNGNTVIVAVSDYSYAPANVVSVTDNKGNVYTKAVSDPVTPSGNSQMSIWYATNVVGGSNLTITATSNENYAYLTLAAHEYSGLSNVDVVSNQSGTGTIATSGLTPTTTQSNELVFGAFLHESGGVITGSPDVNFTLRESQPSGNYEPLFTEDSVVSSVAQYEAILTFSSSTGWRGVVATFK